MTIEQERLLALQLALRTARSIVVLYAQMMDSRDKTKAASARQALYMIDEALK